MAFITILDLEASLGRSLEADEEMNAQYLIDATCAHVESITEMSFSLHEDVTERFMADYYGQIFLTPRPVKDVITVAPLNYNTPTWYWDGASGLYGFYPNQVVNVTYDYGLASAPADIKAVATEMVRSVILDLPEGALRTKQVGDVQYMFTEAAGKNFQGLGNDVLSAYVPIGGTVRLGHGVPDAYGYW